MLIDTASTAMKPAYSEGESNRERNRVTEGGRERERLALVRLSRPQSLKPLFLGLVVVVLAQ